MIKVLVDKELPQLGLPFIHKTKKPHQQVVVTQADGVNHIPAR
jgi:hypothetical protein